MSSSRTYDMSSRRAAMEATREAILDTAVELFTPRWYDEVTLAEIARAAGVSTQTVVNHFGGKSQLYLAGVAERVAPSIRELRSGAVPGDLPSTVDAVLADYESTGESTMRTLGIAPRILTARWLSRFALKSPEIMKRLRLLPTAQLNQALLARAHAALAYAASERLNERFPGSTAAPSASRDRPPWRFRFRHACLVAAATGLLMLPRLTILHLVRSLLAIWFLAFSVTRISALPESAPMNRLPLYCGNIAPEYRIIPPGEIEGFHHSTGAAKSGRLG